MVPEIAKYSKLKKKRVETLECALIFKAIRVFFSSFSQHGKTISDEKCFFPLLDRRP